jgi:hypothetical protein
MRFFSVLAAAAGCALLSACAAGGGLSPQTAATANTVIADGQLFCSFASGPAAGAVVAVVNAADKSAVIVTGKAEDVVAVACPSVNGVRGFPVSPRVNPATAPAVATTTSASRFVR